MRRVCAGLGRDISCAVWWAVALSLFLSLLSVATDELLNRDGMLYVSTARVFVEQGIGAAFAKFNWPFLSLFIGALHAATGLSYIASAHVLNAGLLAALSGAFIFLYREIGGPRVWVAAAVIIFSPYVNEYRAAIIRDPGYWCFGLWAILFLARFCRRGQAWTDALGWQAFVVLSIAFRIEAVALAALLPLYCMVLPGGRLRAWLHCNILFLGGLFVLLMSDVVSLGETSRLRQLQSYLSWTVLTGDFNAKLAVVTGQLQHAASQGDARALLFGGAVGIVLQQVAWGLGILALPLLIGLRQGKLRRDALGPLPWAMGAVALPVLLFTLRDMFLSGRYPGLLVLLLTLPATWALDEYLTQYAGQLRKRVVCTGVAALALILFTLDAVITTDYRKHYLREAAAWAETHVPAKARFYANEGALYFYSGRDYPHLPFVDAPLDDLRRESGRNDWLMLRVSKKDVEPFENLLKGRLDLRQEARFENPRGDAVYALRVEPPVE